MQETLNRSLSTSKNTEGIAIEYIRLRTKDSADLFVGRVIPSLIGCVSTNYPKHHLWLVKRGKESAAEANGAIRALERTMFTLKLPPHIVEG